MLSLRERFVDAFEVGVALGGRLPKDYTSAELELIGTQFNNITPENCMKPALIHPEEGRYDFAVADDLTAFAQQYWLNVSGHCLVWHQQCPDWFFLNQGEPAERDLVLKRMREHIRQVLTRYRKSLQGIDVVNEAIDDGREYIRTSKWKQCVGEDYVEMAFRYANEFGEGIRLYYNDYSIEMPEKTREDDPADSRSEGQGAARRWHRHPGTLDAGSGAVLGYRSGDSRVCCLGLPSDDHRIGSRHGAAGNQWSKHGRRGGRAG